MLKKCTIAGHGNVWPADIRIMLYEIIVHLSSMCAITDLVMNGGLGVAVPPFATGIEFAKLMLTLRVVEFNVPNCQSPQTMPLYPLVVRKLVTPPTPVSEVLRRPGFAFSPAPSSQSPETHP